MSDDHTATKINVQRNTFECTQTTIDTRNIAMSATLGLDGDRMQGRKPRAREHPNR